MKSSLSYGFTLIELLVVISIIGVLSSVVMAGMANARLQGKDAVIRQNMLQLRNLYQTSYADSGDYFDWQFNTIVTTGNCGGITDPNNFSYYCTSAGSTCNNMFMTAIRTPNSQAEKVCNAILATAGGATVDSVSTFAMGVAQGVPGGTKKHFSIGAYLPGKKTYFCVGSGGVSDTAAGFGNGAAGYSAATPQGCFRNP